MSGTIRTIYGAEPGFPASDQHPDAVRYHVGGHWIDAIGGQPTTEEVDAFLHPAPDPTPTTADLLDAVATKLERATTPKQQAEAVRELAQALRGAPS